jgi:hypothetical protein
MNKAQQQRQLAEQMEKASRDAAKLDILWRKLDSELEEEDLVYANRYEVPPPDPKDNSKYNPNKLVDIETFISHPYYLNFRPYPWQILALKLYYLNTEGNTNLELNNALKEEETGCDKCVWKKVLDNETLCTKQIEKEEPYQTFLDPLNSRCLACSRCPLKVRETRIKHEIQITGDKQVEKELEEILENEPEDLFQSEMDMIEEIPDETVREQIKRKIHNNVKFQELVLIVGRRGTKMLDINTPILTTNGWSTMGDVKVGDYVFAPDGNPTRVVAKSEINYTEQAYEMHFSNGDIITAGENHQWETLTKAERKKNSRGKYSKSPTPQIFTTKEIANSLTYGSPRYMLKKNSQTERNEKPSCEFNHAIQITKPLKWPDKKLQIHPYLLGVWLGDGSKTTSVITGLDLEIFNYIEKNCNHNIKHSIVNNKSHWVQEKKETHKTFVNLLKENFLYNNKHIPREYLESSIEQRLELLRGLNDSDGCAIKHNHTVRFVNTNKNLIDNYYELVCGLGFKATIKEKDAKLNGKFISKCWLIAYSVPFGVKVFNLSRKQDIIDNRIKKEKTDKNKIFITKCLPVENKGCQCIEVDHPSHMYLCGRSLIPTHNSFLAVAIALYELYKLLSLPNPQKQLRLPNFQEIHILNVAKNEDQAKDSIYTPMKNSASTSPFFQRYLDEPNELEMRFYTEFDLSENERRAKKGMAPINGTIIAKCGSSSAGGLVGKTCFIIILDELAAMAGDKPDSGVDKKLYDELVPSLATFGKDGKIICLSNPKGPFGQLYYLYENRIEEPTALVIKLPTQMSNANINKKWLAEQKRKDPIEYNMQFGAEFGNNSQNPYFSQEDVADAFANYVSLTRIEQREQNIEYYCHVDPAKTSDYYALAVVHAVKTGERDINNVPIKRFVVDHLQFWAPRQLQQAVPLEEVEEYVKDLHQKFKFKQISFDQWHSSEIVSRLLSQGYPAVIKQFNKDYKDKIYVHLLDIFRTKRINFYKLSSGKIKDKNGKIKDINEIPEAKDQFMFLQKKWSSTGRQVIGALPGYHDDLCDAVAAAVFECDTEQMAINYLPKSRVVYTGRVFR